MSTSQRSFEQVKSILGKLDRDIDAARARRLQNRPTAGLPPAAVEPPSPAPRATTPAPNPDAVAQPVAKPAAPARSPYGRAQPLRPEDRSGGFKP
jgi:hypothetical protein